MEGDEKESRTETESEEIMAEYFLNLKKEKHNINVYRFRKLIEHNKPKET